MLNVRLPFYYEMKQINKATLHNKESEEAVCEVFTTIYYRLIQYNFSDNWYYYFPPFESQFNLF